MDGRHGIIFVSKRRHSGQWLPAKTGSWPERQTECGGGSDSRLILEEAGFQVVAEHDDLFYKVQPPQGWTKQTQGYWTYVYDPAGVERFSQFFKGAWYDRDAFLNVTQR